MVRPKKTNARQSAGHHVKMWDTGQGIKMLCSTWSPLAPYACFCICSSTAFTLQHLCLMFLQTCFLVLLKVDPTQNVIVTNTDLCKLVFSLLTGRNLKQKPRPGLWSDCFSLFTSLWLLFDSALSCCKGISWGSVWPAVWPSLRVCMCVCGC